MSSCFKKNAQPALLPFIANCRLAGGLSISTIHVLHNCMNISSYAIEIITRTLEPSTFTRAVSGLKQLFLAVYVGVDVLG